MSDAKTPAKAENVSKKSEPTKTSVSNAEIAKTETAISDPKSVDNSASKSVSTPKSASQSSTSHFSSVSTPQYRAGWDNIFGTEGDIQKIAPQELSKNNFPKKLNILDYDIDLVLRDLLDTAFNDLAEKRGIELKDAKTLMRFEYSLSCEIKEG